MRITTTVDVDAGTFTMDVEGRIELLPLAVLSRLVARSFALALADASASSYEVAEKRATAARLLATGLTDQQVADTLGVNADQVRAWDDDAATDAEHDQLADALAGS